MPKRVDHDERRRVLVDALMCCVGRAGTTSLTLRDVAVEAGVSIGHVQHYFAGKDDLLAAAARDEEKASLVRITEAVVRLGAGTSERDRMRATALALLPLDRPRRAGALIRRAAPPEARPAGIAGWLGAGSAGFALRERLGAADVLGELRPGVHPDREHAQVAASIAAISDALLDGVFSPGRATAQIDYLLDRIYQPAPPRARAPRSPAERGDDSAGSTAQRIIRAAERHFARTGIDGTSLRDILRDAGQGNAGAVQYHFGSRLGLVAAVIARHRRDEAVRRHALLDAYERTGSTDVRDLAEALVLPLAAKLDDPDGGREYLRINAEYFVKVSREEQMRHAIADTSIPRWHVLLDAITDEATLADPVRRWEPRLLAVRLALIQSAVLAAAPPDPHDPAAVSFLVDAVTAVLTTPRSPRTAAMAVAPRGGWEDCAPPRGPI